MNTHLRAALAALLALAAAQAALGDSTAGMEEQKSTIAQDTDFGGGLVARKGDVTVWVPRGWDKLTTAPKAASFTLAKDASLGGGLFVKAGTRMSVYPNGCYRSLTPSQELRIPGAFKPKSGPVDLVIPADREVWLYDNGDILKATSKYEIDMRPEPLKIKAMTPISFSLGGGLKSLTLAADLPIPGTGMIAQADAEIDFTGKGNPLSFRLAPPGIKLANGMVVPGGARVTLFEDTTRVSACEIKGTWRTKTGILLKDEAQLSLDGGVVAGILAENYRLRDGPLFKADCIAYLDEREEIESGILAEYYEGFRSGTSYSVSAEDPEEE